jgi:two-component system, NtrC family, C4-dicarboxylate transport response regulator DctD
LNHDNFRQDLFYRLQVGECQIPPLRDRQEDIITLFEYFVMQSCENFKIDYQPVSDKNCNVLLSSDWPGNVRELINVATRYVINGFADISQLIPGVAISRGNNTKQTSLKQQVNSFEENLIRSKLSQYQGKVSEVLKDLDLERRTFNQKLSRFGISVSDYRK